MPAFARLYRQWTQRPQQLLPTSYIDLKLPDYSGLATVAELHVLAYQLDCLAQKHRCSRDFTFNSLRMRFARMIACFPVYRSYITIEASSTRETAITSASDRPSSTPREPRPQPVELFHFVRDMLLLGFPAGWVEITRAAQLRFVGKFQQVTAPVMAKGLDDTAFYIYNRLVSLNEVGGEADRFGVCPWSSTDLSRRARKVALGHVGAIHSRYQAQRGRCARRMNVLSECPRSGRAASSAGAISMMGTVAPDGRRTVPDAK